MSNFKSSDCEKCKDCGKHWDRYEECLKQRAFTLNDLSKLFPIYLHYSQTDQYDNYYFTTTEAKDVRAMYQSILIDLISHHEHVIDANEEQ